MRYTITTPWRRQLVFAGLLVIAASTPVHAQSFLDLFIIRQDINTRNTIAQPAFFQLTAPEHKPTAIGAGIGIIGKVVDSPLVTFGPSFEYLRNTDLAKPVDSLKAGAAIEWQTCDVDPLAGGPDHSPVINAKTNYVRDRVKNTNGFQASAVYTHVFVGRRRAFLPNNEHEINPELSVIYSPDVGLEFENDGGSGQATAGHAVRLIAEVTFTAYPLRQKLEQRWELNASVSSRSDLTSTLGYADRQHTIATAAMNYYLLKQVKRTAGVGFTFTDGEDPSKGFAKQRVFQLGLRLQFK